MFMKHWLEKVCVKTQDLLVNQEFRDARVIQARECDSISQARESARVSQGREHERKPSAGKNKRRVRT